MSTAPPDGWGGGGDDDGRPPRADGSGRPERWHYVCHSCADCEGVALSAEAAVFNGDEHLRDHPDHRVAIEEVEHA